MKRSILPQVMFAAAILLLFIARPIGLISTEPGPGMIGWVTRTGGVAYLSPLFIGLEASLLGMWLYLRRKKKDEPAIAYSFGSAKQKLQLPQVLKLLLWLIGAFLLVAQFAVILSRLR